LNIDLIEVISTVGFPIAVSIYLLYSREKAIAKMTEAINELKVVLKGISIKLE